MTQATGRTAAYHVGTWRRHLFLFYQQEYYTTISVPILNIKLVCFIDLVLNIKQVCFVDLAVNKKKEYLKIN